VTGAGRRAGPGWTNPVVRGDRADPSVCRVGEDFYLACSSMDRWPGLPLYHSRDLVNWKPIGFAYREVPDEGLAPMLYAPTLRFHEGRFYLVCTDVASKGNFLISAEDPAGPWSARRWLDQEMFDPSLCFVDDKVYYTRRGSFERKDIVQAELDLETATLGPLESVGVGFWSDDAEGPHLYRIGSWWYLLMAEGGSRALHCATIGRAQSPWGPFEPHPANPFLAQHHAWWHEVLGAGHADLVEAQDGSWWLVYLATRHPAYDSLSQLGRETFLVPVQWRDGWPWVDPEHVRHLEVPARGLPRVDVEGSTAVEDFEHDELPPPWVGVGYPRQGRVSLGERPSFLRIWGGPLQGRKVAGAQAMVARHQADFACEARALVEFEPNEGDRGGLRVYQTDDYRYDLVVARQGGQKVAYLETHVGGLVGAGAPVPLGAERFELVVRCDLDTYSFSVSAEGSEVPLGQAPTRLLGSEVAQTWTGVVIGVWAAGTGGPCRAPLDLDRFEYRGLDGLGAQT